MFGLKVIYWYLIFSKWNISYAYFYYLLMFVYLRQIILIWINYKKKQIYRIEFDLNNCELRVDIFRINNLAAEFESATIDLPKIIEVTIEPSLSEYLVWINSTEIQTQILNAQKKFKSDNGYKTKLCIGRYTKEKHANKMKQLLLNLKTECSN